MIARIVENIASPFYPEFALEVERAARDRDPFLLICNTDADPDIGHDHLRRIAGQLSEGIIAMAGHLRIDDGVTVNRAGLPVVAIDGTVAADLPPWIVMTSPAALKVRESTAPPCTSCAARGGVSSKPEME